MNITPAEKQEKANESFMTLLLIFLCGFKKINGFLGQISQ